MIVRAIRLIVSALLAVALCSATALAQPLPADEVLANMREAGEALEDAAFLLTGRLVDADGTSLNLEVDVEVIPDERVARADIYQPDALADNTIIFAENSVYNYIFLTNQVTIFDADDPDALGGLLGGDGEEGGEFELTLDLDELFEGWDVTVESYDAGVYTLAFANIEEGAVIARAVAEVSEETWLPSDLTLYDQDGGVIAELHVEGLQRNVGLSAEDVTWLPEDAEVIDERD